MRVTARRIRRAPLQEAFVFAKAGRLGCRVREDLEQYKHFLKHILTNREPAGRVSRHNPQVPASLRSRCGSGQREELERWPNNWGQVTSTLTMAGVLQKTVMEIVRLNDP